MFDSKNIHNGNQTVIWQTSALFAMVFNLPASSKHTNFNTPFNFLNCTNQPNLAGMFNVKHTKSLLSRTGSKVPFDSNELPVDMLCEIVDLFGPHEGRVMYPYCGAMTTTIVFIPTGRQCIGIGKNYDALNDAQQRLFGFLPSKT